MNFVELPIENLKIKTVNNEKSENKLDLIKKKMSYQDSFPPKEN